MDLLARLRQEKNPRANTTPQQPTVTLRSRLRSQSSPPTPPPVNEESLSPGVNTAVPAHRDNAAVYHYLCQAFGSSGPYQDGNATHRGDTDTSSFSESMARYGAGVHSDSVDRLVASFQRNDSLIRDFSTAASTAGTEFDALYANIVYPLSATLCSFNTTPTRTTIKRHLRQVEKRLEQAKQELEGLSRQHDLLAKEEATLWETLKDAGRQTKEYDDEGFDDSGIHVVPNDELQMEAFRKEAENIREHQISALMEIEKSFKADVSAAMSKVMQQFLA